MPLAGSIPGCDSGFFEYGGDGAIPMRASEGLTRVPVARLERREHGVAVGTGFPGHYGLSRIRFATTVGTIRVDYGKSFPRIDA